MRPPIRPPSTGAGLARENDFAMGRFRVNDLELQTRSTQVLDILPGKGMYDEVGIRIWVKNRCFMLPSTSYSLDISSNVNRLDGLAVTASDRYLIWAIFNDAGTAFTQFAVTRKPSANFTAVAGASLGGAGVFTLAGTGLNNAYQFTVGARVIVHNGSGAGPNFQWNQGTVSAIGSNTSLTILMDANIPNATTINATTAPAEIIQLSRFRPWDGTNAESVYSNNYRLVGELALNSSSNIVWQRRNQDPWYYSPFTYTNVTRTTVGTTTTTYQYYRYAPTWMEQFNCSIACSSNNSGGIGHLTWSINQLIAGTRIIGRVAAPLIVSVAEFLDLEGPCRDGQGVTDLVMTTATAGTLSQLHQIIGWTDGGLRE